MDARGVLSPFPGAEDPFFALPAGFGKGQFGHHPLGPGDSPLCPWVT